MTRLKKALPLSSGLSIFPQTALPSTNMPTDRVTNDGQQRDKSGSARKGE